MSYNLSDSPILFFEDSKREEFLKSVNHFLELKNSTAFSIPMRLNDFPYLEVFIIWYINNSIDKAFRKSISDETNKQHTVPNFLIKSLNRETGYSKKNEPWNKSFNFAEESNTVRATQNTKNGKWKIDFVSNKKISVFQNIYDVADDSIPKKFTECFLSIVENDAASIINRINNDILNQEVTWYERVVLSCYGVLQNARTISRMQHFYSQQEEFISSSMELHSKNGDLINREQAIKNITDILGMGYKEFGHSVVHSLRIYDINLFFSRKWSFVYAPDGLATTLSPLKSFDSERSKIFKGVHSNPNHLILPLGRNILWVLSLPDPKKTVFTAPKLILSQEENQFANELISLQSNEIFCHPDDTKNILPYIYSTEVIDFYSRMEPWLLDETKDPYKLYLTNELFDFIPGRWRF